jgi:hypothetical protein
MQNVISGILDQDGYWQNECKHAQNTEDLAGIP